MSVCLSVCVSLWSAVCPSIPSLGVRARAWPERASDLGTYVRMYVRISCMFIKCSDVLHASLNVLEKKEVHYYIKIKTYFKTSTKKMFGFFI